MPKHKQAGQTTVLTKMTANIDRKRLQCRSHPQRSFRWAVDGDFTAANIASFLILDTRMPRSLSYSLGRIVTNLGYLAEEYGETPASHDMAVALRARVSKRDIGAIFEEGLHEFISSVLRDTASLGQQIEQDYRFTR